MNLYLYECPPGARYGEPQFRDPLIYDTRLTAAGRAQAAAAAAAAARLAPRPEVVVVSPLTRALETADAAFGGVDAPRVVTPLATERLYLSSDVGRVRAQLEVEFPHHDFTNLGGAEAPWWHTGDGSDSTDGEGASDFQAVVYEPEVVFLQRVERLRQWLAARPECSLALVSHWGVIHALTGAQFANCEMRTLALGQLCARPFMLRGEAAAGSSR
eukprot:scaffold4.g4821.t1